MASMADDPVLADPVLADLRECLSRGVSAADYAARAAAHDDDGVLERATRLALSEVSLKEKMGEWATELFCCRLRRKAALGDEACAELCPNGASARRVFSAMTAVARTASPCGHVFELGDIAWNCTTCQKDPTCVLCDGCFRASDHAGHEVFFHRAAPGGCCDCGDPEAWLDEKAHCRAHAPVAEAEGEAAFFPTEASAQLVVGAVVGYIVGVASECVASHEPPPPEAEGLKIRVHDDDVHALDEVVEALRELGLEGPRCRELALAVDRDGDALAPLEPLDAAKAGQLLRRLQGRGILGAAVSEAQLAREARATQLAEWISEELIKKGSAATRKVASLALSQQQQHYYMGSLLASRFGIAETVEASTRGRVPTKKEEELAQQRLDSSAFALLLACDALLPRRLRLASRGLALRSLVDVRARLALADALLALYPALARLFAKGVGTSDETVFALSVQIFTTPSIVLRLVDSKRPNVLSVVLYALIGALQSAGCDDRREVKREQATEDAQEEENDDEEEEEFPDNDDEEAAAAAAAAHFFAPGANTTHVAFPFRRRTRRSAAWLRRESGDNTVDAFLEHLIIRNRRFALSLRDFEYVLQTETVARRILEGSDSDSSALKAWLALLSRLQASDALTRRGEDASHVEYESRRWVAAFNLSLSVASASERLVHKGLVIGGAEDCFLYSYWRCTAALLEWLAKREGSKEWRGIPRSEAISAGLSVPELARSVLLFDVTSQKVSVHIPLHRFVACLVLRALDVGLTDRPMPDLRTCASKATRDRVRRAVKILDKGAVEDTEWKTLGSTSLAELFKPSSSHEEASVDDADVEMVSEVVARALVEAPLRALAFVAHVGAGGWRRNGHSAASIGLSYATPPLCHVLRDLDFAAVQIGLLTLGAEHVISLALERFCVDRYLLEPQSTPADAARGSAGAIASSSEDRKLKPCFSTSVLAQAAVEAVWLICRLATELPGPAGEVDFLRREIVHSLAVAPQKRSQLAALVAAASKARGHPAPPKLLDALLDACGVHLKRAADDDVANYTWDLRPELALEYDASFARLSRMDHEKAAERVSAIRDKMSSKKQPLPLVQPPPKAHACFEPARDAILRAKATSAALKGALARAARKTDARKTDEDDNNGSMRELECAAVHLATLMTHQELAAGSGESALFAEWVGTEGVAERLIQLQGKGLSMGMYDAGLSWVLKTAGSRCAALKNMLPASLVEEEEEEVEVAASSPDSNEVKMRRLRSEKARQRTLKAMAKRQAQFAASIVETEVEQEHDDECIVCRGQGGPDAPLGLVALNQRSTVLARVDDRLRHNRKVARRWLALDDALVRPTRQGEDTGVRLPASTEVEVTATHRGEDIALRGGGWVSVKEHEAVVPLRRYAFQRWGRTRIQVSSCGHSMHVACWDAYFASIVHKALEGENFDGRSCVDISRREFVCPLCKALANTLVPRSSEEEEEPLRRREDGCDATSVAQWALSGGASSSSEEEPATVKKASTQELNATKRFFEQLTEVSHSGGGRAVAAHAPPPKALPAVFTAWAAAAYSALALATQQQEPSESAPPSAQQLEAQRASALGATAAIRSLGWCADSLAAEDDDETLVEKTRSRLASILSGSKPPADVMIGQEPALVLGTRAGEEQSAEESAFLALAQPLLSWDLTVTLAALVSLWPREDLARIARSIALARLAQLLLEPRFRAGGSRVFEGGTTTGLSQLRAVLCGRMGLRVSESAIGGASLTEAVAAAWTPQLRVARCFLGDDDDTDGSSCEACRVALGVPSPDQIAASTSCLDLMERWADRLAEASPRPTENIEEEEASDDSDVLLGDLRRGDDTHSCDDGDDEEGDERKQPVGSTPIEMRSQAAAPKVPLLSSFVGAHTAVDARGVALRRPIHDSSHLGLTLETTGTAHRFVTLPDTFTNLYHALFERKNTTDAPSDDAAICLLTGKVVRAGARAHPGAPGECTKLAREHGDGIGVYFLLLKCSVLLMRGSHAAYWKSLYVDEHGEDDVGLRRGAPLSLSHDRLDELQRLYNSHGVAREVARLRTNSSRVIRDDYY